jgi:hypothetical protein
VAAEGLKKEKPARTPLCQSGTAEHRDPVAAEEEQQLLQGWNTRSCLQMEDDCQQSWRLHCKILCLQQRYSEVLWNLHLFNV